MAPRISGSATPRDTAPGIDLPPLAQELLAEGDVEGYRHLFARARAVSDVHRRHWATTSLLEQGLEAGSSPAHPHGLDLLRVAVAGALDSLEREPAEPALLGLCGTALLRLGGRAGSAALLDAARRLDPARPGMAGRLAELGAHAPAVGSQDATLERRAVEIAGRARPASGLTLSLCMIVRDEEQMLPRCLASVAEVVQEIVVVDTGSRDATRAVAESFGARVISHAWRDSFAEARNVSLDAAEGDWLVYLDADEALVAEDAALLGDLTGRTWREAFYLSEINHTGELADGTSVRHRALRVFRNRPEYRFEGRVHEQIARRLPGFLPERVEATSIRIEHFGYLGSVRARREKSARNIGLLRMQEADGPPDAFLLFNLGSERAAAGDEVGAVSDLERAWVAMLGAPEHESREFGPALASRLVGALRACGLAEDAIARAADGLERYPGFTDLVFEQAMAALSLGDHARARDLLERCIEMGDAPAHYPARKGCGGVAARVALGEVLAAQAEHLAAAATLAAVPDGDPLALEARRREAIALLTAGAGLPEGLIERLRTLGLPDRELDVLAAWQELLLAGATERDLPQDAVEPLCAHLEALLRSRDFAAFELLLSLLERTSVTARERHDLLGEMYLRCGFASSAAEEWMAVCAEQPDSRALVGLARVAASSSMDREAEEFAAAALAIDPEDEAARLLLDRARMALSSTEAA